MPLKLKYIRIINLIYREKENEYKFLIEALKSEI
jgi:hypothetical protein